VRFAVLGSGSRGNGMVVEVGATLLLIDCGLSVLQVKRRLAGLDKRPEDLTAIVVTHEHSDHVGGVAGLARAYDLPVWATPGTALAAGLLEVAGCELFDCHAPFSVADIELMPFPVPHDAREPSQLVCGDGRRRLGVLTDVGSLTPHIETCLDACDALVLECNHDAAMLAAGMYAKADYLQMRMIGIADGGLFAEDLNSLNGTLLDGEAIAPFQPEPLQPEQVLTLGQVVLTIARLSGEAG